MIRLYYSERTEQHADKAGEHSAGLELLRLALEDSCGLALTSGELTEMTVLGTRGKPSLRGRDDIHFNISHSGGVTVCAVADVPIGADVEVRRGRDISDALKRRVLTDEEIALTGRTDGGTDEFTFLRFWTLKEAYLKWKGCGLAEDMRDVSFRPGGSAGEGSFVYAWCSDKDVSAVQRIHGGSSVISLVLEKPDRPEEISFIRY